MREDNGSVQEMTFDFDGLIQLLANHLYSEKKVFIRELIQNAHDAIHRRAKADPAFDREQGQIDVLTDLATGSGRIIFRDNGLGMTEPDLVDFLSSIGSSSTREAATETPDVIGQFGIGFLSGFLVGDRVQVRTRHYASPVSEGRLWDNDGSKHYSISAISKEHIGTEVTVHLADATDRGLIQDESVRQNIRQYADMLRVPIYLNDPHHSGPPANTRVMPWERQGTPPDELRFDSLVYLEKTVPDSVLEVIPIPPGFSVDAHVEGLLYVTRTRVLGRDAPRTVRVFSKRMFVCEDAADLLPPWATFINGVINTDDLKTNAARDNFARDDIFERLREILGDCIIAHFDQLQETNPQRLAEILAYHMVSIRAACHYYPPFFARFGQLLQWRVNAASPSAKLNTGTHTAEDWRSGDAGAFGWATLDEVLESMPTPAGGERYKVSCFTSSNAANQYFEMADATNSTVVDASGIFEGSLLRAWADNNRSRVELVHVDRENDPAVFLEIDQDRDRDVARLARIMTTAIRPEGTGRVRVEARRFRPDALPAVLKYDSEVRGAVKATEILDDPNTSDDLRMMARDLLNLSRHTEMRMTINAGNPLICKLAGLVAEVPNDPDLADLLLGVYNDAILYNQELMTPSNAQLFHNQFQRLMARSLEFVQQRAELQRQQVELDRQRAETAGMTKRRHLVGFLMTPFASSFDLVREAFRVVVEDRLGCELRTADERTFADLVRGNVEAHLADADFFVADITGANPNVMLELGAAIYGRPGQPTLLFAGTTPPERALSLPADLGGSIAGTYTNGAALTVLVDELTEKFVKHQRLRSIRELDGVGVFLSPRRIEELTGGLLRDGATYERLGERFPTSLDWAEASEADVRTCLGTESDLASVVLGRVNAGLAR